jgi:phage repressor protein C with HTH and peptisase S24 domain
MGWGEGNSRIGNYASDKREPSLADIEQMAKALGVSKEWLAFDSGQMNSTPTEESVIPFHHDMRASAGPGAYNDAGVSEKGLKFQNWSLSRRKLSSSNLHAWVVSGTSMAPYIPDRSTIVFDVSDKEVHDGCIYVINWGGDTFVKRLYKELDGRIRVVSDNASDPSNRDRLTDPEADGFIVEGRVRWVGFWLD